VTYQSVGDVEREREKKVRGVIEAEYDVDQTYASLTPTRVE